MFDLSLEEDRCFQVEERETDLPGWQGSMSKDTDIQVSVNLEDDR